MIFRKPYAFLIKNFKKIHIVLLLLCVFVFFKVNSIMKFVKEFISYGTYSASLEPFSKNTGFLFYLALILIIISSLLLLILLKRKQKPWKIYLLYILEYILLFFSVISISNYFASYGVGTSLSGVLIYRDMLRICLYVQYPILILICIRMLGIDLKNFDFKHDKEFLELDSEDQEEFEISFNFDKNSIIRLFNRTKRNVYYFYKEHAFICNIVLCVSSIYILYQGYYYFGVSHKSYKQGDTFNSGIYSITIKDSYITDKDLSGKKIENGSKFVVIVMKLKNNSNRKVEPNLARYHLMNGSSDKVYTNYYNNYFTDIGKAVNGTFSLYPNKSREFYLVFKVNEKLRKNRFVLYYQELGGKLVSYLRKIRLNLVDVTEIKDMGSYNIGDKITFTYINSSKKELVPFKSEIGEVFTYNRYYCPSASVCSSFVEEVRADSGKKILKLSFSSSDFEGEEFVDFSSKYGRIKYKDSKGNNGYVAIESAIKTGYQGKDVFIIAKSEVLDSSELSIVYTLRNKRYILKIK